MRNRLCSIGSLKPMNPSLKILFLLLEKRQLFLNLDWLCDATQTDYIQRALLNALKIFVIAQNYVKWKKEV